MENAKKIGFIVIVALVLVCGFVFPIPKVLAATGGGTATIAVDGGSQGAGVTVVQSTTHIFTTVLTIDTNGMTLGASSPTFTIPTGLTAPTTHAVATPGLVNADGQWSVVANGGGCAVDSSPVSSTTIASGQVITVDITADCAAGNTITLTYRGTSAITMGATALTVSTANAGDTSPVTPLIAGSPTITVTAAVAPTPTPTSSTTTSPASSAVFSASLTSLSSGGVVSALSAKNCPNLKYVIPIIVKSKRHSPTSVFISWGPYSGINTFSVRYGLTNGNWAWNTNVTGFSTTIESLPLNQPIWIQVAATDGCSIGTYGDAKLIGEPSLPNTGFAPQDDNNLWYIILAVISSL